MVFKNESKIQVGEALGGKALESGGKTRASVKGCVLRKSLPCGVWNVEKTSRNATENEGKRTAQRLQPRRSIDEEGNTVAFLEVDL